MKNIFVTGGSGFIGSHTCLVLLERGYNVIALDSNINSSRNFVMIGIAGADSTIFNAEEKNRHFQINTSQDESTVIQGIKFINGKKDYSGGSIYLSESSISFKNCIFEKKWCKRSIE